MGKENETARKMERQITRTTREGTESKMLAGKMIRYVDGRDPIWNSVCR